MIFGWKTKGPAVVAALRLMMMIRLRHQKLKIQKKVTGARRRREQRSADCTRRCSSGIQKRSSLYVVISHLAATD